MTWSDGRRIIAARRERVAQLHVRGLTQREIQQALPMGENPMVNPKTGKPFDLAQINRDLKELNKRWLANADLPIAQHRAQHLAALEELRRAAWAKSKLDTVLRALEREAKMLGMDAPQVHEVSGRGGELLRIVMEVVDGPVVPRKQEAT